MTVGQRARLLKTGGVIAFVVLLLYLFTSRDGAGVRDMVKGMLDHHHGPKKSERR